MSAAMQLPSRTRFARGAIVRRETGSHNMLVVRDLGTTVAVAFIEAGSLCMREFRADGLMQVLEQGAVPLDDGMTAAQRYTLFLSGWEGARQGLEVAQSVIDTVRDNPKSSFAEVIFGHGLYRAARAAAERRLAAAGTEGSRA